MKLRIKGNSLRFRLTQGEVTLLLANGKISEALEFGPEMVPFVYSLETRDGFDGVSASFEDGKLIVFIPDQLASEWNATEKVSIESSNIVPTILIEKDFACLTPRPGEDESDMFPNPVKAACVTDFEREMNLAVTGYVLTGGASSRMGENKALLELDGEALGARAAGILDSFAGDVFTVGFPIDGLECIPDMAPKSMAASIFGLQAALRHSPTEWTAILACDLPFVTVDLFQLLEAAALQGEIDAVIPEQSDGRIQPLAALYRTGSSLNAVNDMIDAGEFRLASLFTRLRHRRLLPSEYSSLRGAKNFFFNINTPVDYQAALNLQAAGV